MIRRNIRFPFMVFCHTAPALRMHKEKIVPVKIEPVMIRSSARPSLIKLPGVVVAGSLVALMHICPGAVPRKSIRIQAGIHDDNGICQQSFNFLHPGGCKIIGC